MKLTEKDNQTIASQMKNEEGNIFFEKDGETFEAFYTLEFEGYFEDDYSNGTGAYIIEAAIVTLDAVSYDENGDTELEGLNINYIEELLKQ
ncbi:MAG: hypothetical protein ACRCZY_01905 [Phocaeicola sp.]